ncbi:DUF4124 domain-containing protein [Lysobacter niastensis]|uniref:DUF4124 domain-containing protein n=2 Tax=Lysobacter niastensis TaxID=380629 RepID=A0ABS0B501_9GAMM|nr:DUF4124 domain-containing protein [Lysobacter niastensis]
MRARMSALLLTATVAAVAGVHAAEITIYRCTDASGHLTLRDTPCRKGETQQALQMQRPTDPPRRAKAPATPAPAAVEEDEAPAPYETAVVLQPRPMYECIDLEGEPYLSDTAEGNPRWVELWALGYPVATQRNPLGDNVGGPRPRPPETGPGPPRLPVDVGLAMTPGSWIRDPCYALPPEEICARLRDHRYELGRRYNSALQSERARIDTEQRQLDARLDNECGGR